MINGYVGNVSFQKDNKRNGAALIGNKDGMEWHLWFVHKDNKC